MAVDTFVEALYKTVCSCNYYLVLDINLKRLQTNLIEKEETKNPKFAITFKIEKSNTNESEKMANTQISQDANK